MLSSSGYQTMDARFRSPGVPRKSGIEEAAAKIAKKSKRSKSTENSLEKIDPFMRLCTKDGGNLDDPLAVLNKRWSIIAKNQESMSKQELLNNYRLLMNDHLRLERFLSILTKDNDMARNRLETDLLDAMMCIEDLKQALEVRMARRRKIDPREAEERRALIRQNKKLLNQLYESAKKIENLELAKLEMKEQLELLDFQMMEVENQKSMIEEELRRQPVCENGETQTENLDTGPSAVAMARAETAAVLSELASNQAESAALHAKHRHLENLVRELRRDNSELREQVARHDEESENSLAESDMHTRGANLQAELAAKLEQLCCLEEKLVKSEASCDNLRAQLRSRQASGEGKNEELQRLYAYLRKAKGVPDDSVVDMEEGCLLIGAELVQKLAGEIESDDLSSVTGDTLLAAIRKLKRLRNSLLSTSSKNSVRGDSGSDPSSPEYYSAQFAQLQITNETDNVRAQLAVCEKRRTDLENRVAEISNELTRAKAENRANETALTASRRTEAALRRRLLAAMDTSSSGGQRQSGRPISSAVDFMSGSSVASSPPLEEQLDAQTKMIKLEASNTALSEANQLDRARLQEQATRISQLEAEHRTLHDRMASLQASESCAQRASVRLQALYEDMLREFSESSTQEAKAAARRKTRPVGADLRGYETDTAVHMNPNRHSADDAAMLKPCGLTACAEVRAVLATLEERFIRTAEQLSEAEALLSELGSGTAEPMKSKSVERVGLACPQLMAALRMSLKASGRRWFGADGDTTMRLLSRLERLVTALFSRSTTLETELRQRIVDLQMALSESASSNGEQILKESLDSQRKELLDLQQKLDQIQDELEVTKTFCEGQSVELAHFRDSAFTRPS